MYDEDADFIAGFGQGMINTSMRFMFVGYALYFAGRYAQRKNRKYTN